MEGILNSLVVVGVKPKEVHVMKRKKNSLATPHLHCDASALTETDKPYNDIMCTKTMQLLPGLGKRTGYSFAR